MATTFNLFSDANLTTAYSGSLQATQNSDGTTSPIEFTCYMGSLGSAGGDTTDRKVEADSNPGVDQIAVSIVNATAAWQASTAYALNDMVRTTTVNGYEYKATTAGTSGGSEPAWPTTIGNTVADGSVVWTNSSKIHEATEIKLAATQGGLAGATAGAAMNLGTSVVSSVANAKPIWIQVDDATGEIATETELSLSINTMRETVV